MMKKTILACLAVLSLVAMPCPAQNPLQEEILSAKTVCLTGGTQDLLDIAAGELNKWGGFQVVASRREADVVFDFGLSWQPGQVAVETLTITNARTGERLYQGDRVGHFAGWSHMMRSLLTDLRGRIELESTTQFGTRAAKYFSDGALLNEKLATNLAKTSPSLADSSKNAALNWNKFAAQLSQWNSDTAKKKLTVEDLGRKHNLEAVEKYHNEILAYTCQQLKIQAEIGRSLDSARASLPSDVVQALDVVEGDAAALSADCNSKDAAKPVQK
jgi:hypothetical protein